MSELKFLHLIGESDESWEHAVQAAVKEAAQAVQNIQTVYIKEFLAVVEGDEIVNYKVNAKITFQA